MTQQSNRLASPPIVEALIDLQLWPVLDSLDSLLPLSALIQAQFPERRTMHTLQATIKQEKGQPASSTSKHEEIGYQFWSSDKRRVVQLRKNGLSFSVLKPYGRWEALEAQAADVFDAVKAVRKFDHVSRVAVRYVNRIELPLPPSGTELRFEDYLRTHPEVSSGLPQTVSEMFMRVVLPRPEAESTVIITEALEAPDLARKVLPVLLDIDVFSVGQFSGDAAWARLERMRPIKNEVFFACLTPKALELLK
ncbi:MAG: TIGR04255 family protein [Archangiaceae bacterium]|nr:TIGR04255 family protein [Archangiaceae bacterium]